MSTVSYEGILEIGMFIGETLLSMGILREKYQLPEWQEPHIGFDLDCAEPRASMTLFFHESSQARLFDIVFAEYHISLIVRYFGFEPVKRVLNIAVPTDHPTCNLNNLTQACIALARRLGTPIQIPIIIPAPPITIPAEAVSVVPSQGRGFFNITHDDDPSPSFSTKCCRIS